MTWLTGRGIGRGAKLRGPSVPAVGVRIYLHGKDGRRVVLMLNDAFVKECRLQPGDRLQIGMEANCIKLRRHPEGNAIVGRGFSESRDGKPSKISKATPYVSYNETSFPQVVEWASAHKNNWVTLKDLGNRWLSDAQ